MSPSTRKELLAFAGVIGCLVLIAALWKLGERQQNQPKTVVMKDGRRIECKKVNDQGQYWGMVLKDGRASAVKKEDVLEIVEASPAVHFRGFARSGAETVQSAGENHGKISAPVSLTAMQFGANRALRWIGHHCGTVARYGSRSI